jgi:hypothetical protein
MNGNTAVNANLLTLAIVAIVVVRFLMRELRWRVITVRRLWIRPIVLIILTLALAAGAVGLPDADIGLTIVALIGGAIVGAITGALVVRSTTFEPAGLAGAVRARGSAVTVAIWIVALALRFAARYALRAGDASSPAGQAQFFALNAGLVALVAAAFVVVAIGFHRAIDRYGSTPAVPTSRTL